ncbi:MAG: 5-formyltetrahydrofolate cyclo-ligase [Acidimicrobiia bacterium]
MDKDRLRAGARGGAAIEPETARAVISGLFGWLSGRLPGTVAAYLAMQDEVEVEPLFDSLPGWRWVLPRVEPDGTLTWRDREVSRETHRFGMRQPVDRGPEIPVHEIDVFLVPGMAFDETGARLGRGGGHYDRVLALRRKDSDAVGVTVESRVIASVPVHHHDQRVDWLATETGVRECRPKKQPNKEDQS